MDTKTFFITALFVTLTINAGMALVFWTRRTYPGFGYWLAGSCCRSVGSILFILQRSQFPPELTVILANYLFLAESMLFIRGTLIFRGRPPIPYGWDLAVFLSFSSLFAYFIHVEPSLTARIVVFSLYCCALDIWMLRVLLTRRPAYFGTTDIWQAWIWGALAVFNLTRAGYTWAFERGAADFMALPQLQTFMVMILVMAALMIALTQIIMNAQRVEYDLRMARKRLEEDLEERKRMEEALRQSETTLRSIFAVAPVGICIAKERTLQIINQAWYKITGYSEADGIVGCVARMLYESEEEFERVGREVFNSLRQYGAASVRTRHVRKDGSLCDVILTAALLQPDNPSAGTVITLEDITDRLKSEEESRKLQAQFHQAQKMESVGRLAGGIAHDFNNMLGVILGHTELAMFSTDGKPPLHNNLLEIRKAAERSADLTRQLLAFARRQTIAPKVLDLNTMVEGMLKMLKRLIGEDIDLSWAPGANLWAVKIDPGQIDQLMMNLCVNARDAIDGVGKITIETGATSFDAEHNAGQWDIQPGDYVTLIVSDNGCGMDAETKAKIFEPFFTTKDVNRGTGLGLATVYGIVKQNDGFINVYSEPGQGTTFKIYLRRHNGTEAVAEREAPSAAPAGGHETVLLVEDEQAILKMTATMLERQGYTVLTASTPGEAIELAQKHDSIRLLITDVIMPGMNGQVLAEKLGRIHPEMKCLYMSGYTANVIAHHGVLDEGIHFIQKPFSRATLAAKVREALG